MKWFAVVSAEFVEGVVVVCRKTLDIFEGPDEFVQGFTVPGIVPLLELLNGMACISHDAVSVQMPIECV